MGKKKKEEDGRKTRCSKGETKKCELGVGRKAPKWQKTLSARVGGRRLLKRGTNLNQKKKKKGERKEWTLQRGGRALKPPHSKKGREKKKAHTAKYKKKVGAQKRSRHGYRFE